MAAGLLALSLASTARGPPDPKDPTVTLYERPPAGTATPVPSPEEFPELKRDAAGYLLVDFRHLASFTFGKQPAAADDPMQRPLGRNGSMFNPYNSDNVELPTAPGQSGPIPANVQALDGQHVRITGFMLPIRLEDGLVKECLLLRNQTMCCYGRRPEPNEWVVVRLAGKGVPSTMDTPLVFSGTLHVGEMFHNEVFEGLYELDGETVAAK